MRVEDIETFNFDKAGTDLGNAYDEGYKQGSKHTAREFAEIIKTEIFSILKCKNTGFVNKEEIKFCSTMSKQLLYQINKHLNEDYGFNLPLFANYQFLAELELAKQYGIDLGE